MFGIFLRIIFGIIFGIRLGIFRGWSNYGFERNPFLTSRRVETKVKVTIVSFPELLIRLPYLLLSRARRGGPWARPCDEFQYIALAFLHGDAHL